MASKNIVIKKRNGSGWDILYPATLDSNVAVTSDNFVANNLNEALDELFQSVGNSNDKKELENLTVDKWIVSSIF